MEKEMYRPASIEFDVANNSIVPENLGKFKDAKEAVEFIHKNMVGINQKITVFRFMDNHEKTELRKEYQDILEMKMLLVEKELQKATVAYNEAKKALTDAKEMVNATTNEVKALANEVKLGVKDITLDDNFTWRVPFEGKYYFYTFIDLQIKLAKVSLIPDYEKTDLYNSMTTNEDYFTANYGTEEEKAELKKKIKIKKLPGGDGTKANPVIFPVEEGIIIEPLSTIDTSAEENDE